MSISLPARRRAGGVLHMGALLGLLGLAAEAAAERPAVRAQEVRPLWTDASGRPTACAQQAVAMLGRASDDGLEPADYDATALRDEAVALALADAPPHARASAFETSLGFHLLALVEDLHRGRVDPRWLGFGLTRPVDRDLSQAIRDACDRGRLPALAAEVAPQLSTYRALRSALTRYRTLAADATLVPPDLPTQTLRIGAVFGGAAALHEWLVRLGDIPAITPPPVGDVMADATVEGVKRFQTRHGLTADGVIGRRTAAALRVPLVWRVRQLELSLERLRWLPAFADGPLVVVNIPMFRLWASNNVPAIGPPAISMNVIVGRAVNARTPLLVEEMEYVVFRPYWNVPTSIVKAEILPTLARDPDYLTREQLEIVTSARDDATVVPFSPEAIDALGRGTLRLRQRPGPRNALGLVKFVFPNRDDVYMHATPAPELFEKDRRDFSHGCIRVEDPEALAAWALASDAQWTRERIAAAMHGADATRVTLPRPIRVVLFYATAAVDPVDGTVHFASDVYGHDGPLDAALKRKGRGPQ